MTGLVIVCFQRCDFICNLIRHACYYLGVQCVIDLADVCESLSQAAI